MRWQERLATIQLVAAIAALLPHWRKSIIEFSPLRAILGTISTLPLRMVGLRQSFDDCHSRVLPLRFLTAVTVYR